MLTLVAIQLTLAMLMSLVFSRCYSAMTILQECYQVLPLRSTTFFLFVITQNTSMQIGPITAENSISL